ncbi:FABP family protein [Solicola sp. PLA-1-18]|uniref:FABP family protein n=1 Tax=Solicola sp. PLA-1-18 TaxID=3380532 RepID=UPI003B7D4A1A
MAFEIPSDLHKDLMPLAFLLGTWHGDGHGAYPTIDAYTFEEDVAFAHDGRAFLHYFSRQWVTDEAGERVGPGDLETGFLRVVEDGVVELVLAQQSGYAQIWYGTIEGPRLTLTTDVSVRTGSAVELTAAQRMYGLVDGDLMYAYDVAADGQEMQSRTWAQLKRL